MAFSTRTVSISASLLIAAACIVGALFLSGASRFPTANAESTEELLKIYAAKDTDGDLLPDWQEELYGTDPTNIHSIDPSKTDKEAVDEGLVKPRFSSEKPDPLANVEIKGKEVAPNTLTGRFGQQFFASYFSQHGTEPPTEADILAFVKASVKDLSASQAPVYNASELTIVADGPDALTAYVVQAEMALNSNSLNAEKSELLYFADAVEKNDTAALKAVQKSAKAYAAIAHALSKVPVPTSAAAAHLHLVNMVAKVGTTIGDMGAFDTDPLRGFVGLDAYTGAVVDMAHAFAALHPFFASAGISLTKGEPGYEFYVIAERTVNLPH